MTQNSIRLSVFTVPGRIKLHVGAAPLSASFALPLHSFFALSCPLSFICCPPTAVLAQDMRF